MADVIGRFTALLMSGRAKQEDMASLKVAAAAIQGKLEAHPLLHGISLQCLRLIEKQERGIDSMRGRRSSKTEAGTCVLQQKPGEGVRCEPEIIRKHLR